jgi:hypothetical protein
MAQYLPPLLGKPDNFTLRHLGVGRRQARNRLTGPPQ